MKYFYFTIVLSTTLLMGCKKEKEQINDLCLYKLESTLISNDSLQKKIIENARRNRLVTRKT